MKSRPQGREHWALLSLATLGVVYGDIGTSLLYAFRECFAHGSGLEPTRDNVLGVLSLIFWSLVIVVTVKYVTVIMRADNRGEGGIVALMALARKLFEARPWLGAILMPAGLIGLALFMGDAAITPAISVLSAVEGLSVATPSFQAYVVPISLGVLIALFMIQSRGTAIVGRMFGPIVCVWFSALAVLGVGKIIDYPDVLSALDPSYAAAFIAHRGWAIAVTLGAIVLVVTGVEALYADMGHFGRKPIGVAWLSLVFPALVLNYFGQGALVIHDPHAVRNPFFLMVGDHLLYPMVALATAATVIASQAVISGAFSLVHQAIQLGYAPRLNVRHTSERQIGQIYIARVNWALMVAVIGLVVAFRSSSHLAAAYGIAVTGTMAMTTILTSAIALYRWNWPTVFVILVFGIFLLIDLVFFGANALKVLHGGWVPLAIAVAVYFVISTWIRGRDLLYERLNEQGMRLDAFVDSITPNKLIRVPGTAVYMTRAGDTVPHSLLHNIKHNKVLHERVVLLTVITEEIPFVESSRHIEVIAYPKRFYRLLIRYGFKETPELPKAFARCAEEGLELDLAETSFFLGRVTLVIAERSTMSRWRRRLFFVLANNSLSAPDFFRIPPNRVVEVGAQLAL